MKTYKFAIAGSFALIVFFQWVHFSFYFQQPMGISFLWSMVDWSVWFLLGIGLIGRDAFRYCWRWGIAIVLLLGPAQILLSTMVYNLLYQTDKTIIESFFHLMNKRWLQNIFIAAVMLLVMMYLKQKQLHKQISEQRAVDSAGDQELSLLLDDGKHTYQLHGRDILAVVSAKNYVSVYTTDKEIVVRDTLKNMQARLEPDQFIQVSRSALVNRTEVTQIERYSKTSFRAVLSNQHTINIGRTFVESVQQCLHLSPQGNRSSL